MRHVFIQAKMDIGCHYLQNDLPQQWDWMKRQGHMNNRNILAGHFNVKRDVKSSVPSIFQRGPKRTVPKTVLQNCAIRHPRRISSNV